MTVPENVGPSSRRPLRLWPGLGIVAVQWVIILLAPLVLEEGGILAILGGAAAGLLVLIWWLFFSRALWVDRLGALVLMVLTVLLAYRVVHPSISNGLMGRMVPIFSMPLLSLALVGSVAATRHRPDGVRRFSMAVALLLVCGVMALARTAGITGDASPDLHWRWTPTPEQRLLAQGDEPLSLAPPVAAPPAAAPSENPVAAPATATPAPDAAKGGDAGKAAAAKAGEDAAPADAAPAAAAKSVGEWPGFRGPRRDGVIRAVRLETDWSQSPPVELWRRPIGPGWSSFAVHGSVIYTQEQRGDDEIVSANDLATGKPVWRHRDATRFYESNGGPGPRGTPAYSNGRVYTHGATGIVNALDARTGALLWTRNASADTGSTIPGWGFTSSPLALDDAVIVASSGRLVSYDAATGKPRWTRQTQGGGYSSPQLMTLGGVPQIVLLSGGGATGIAPADGSVLWEFKREPVVSIVQPALADGDLLVASGDAMGGLGLRRVAVTRGANGWTVEERWASRGLKPYFNDFIVHDGHAFGFDGRILSCINLEDGNRTWKGGRYGAGQMVALPDQDLLLVLSEEGELALVKAASDQFTEVAKFKAIEGKTWNHPVLAGEVLLVRNGEEMAAFRLSLASR